MFILNFQNKYHQNLQTHQEHAYKSLFSLWDCLFDFSIFISHEPVIMGFTTKSQQASIRVF